MVATAILGAGLGAVTAGVAMAVRTAALTEGYEQARLLAEEQLSLFLIDWEGGEAERKGDAAGRNWQVAARPHPKIAGLYEITAEVGFRAAGAERAFRLETREVERGKDRGR